MWNLLWVVGTGGLQTGVHPKQSLPLNPESFFRWKHSELTIVGGKDEDEGASAVAISSAIQEKNPLTGWLLDYNIELTLSRNRRSSRCESNAYSSVTG